MLVVAICLFAVNGLLVFGTRFIVFVITLFGLLHVCWFGCVVCFVVALFGGFAGCWFYFMFAGFGCFACASYLIVAFLVI